jgi:hypothetical protein
MTQSAGAYAMDVYNLGKVDLISDLRDDVYFEFNVIGVHGQPLVAFAFRTREEAEAAHKAMQAIVSTAKIITPYALSR